MPESTAEEVASSWRGIRQDSGDPITEANNYLFWLGEMGVSPDQAKTKVCIFSDGLDAEPIVNLYNHYKGSLITPFGWGTLLTNDFIGCLDHDDYNLFRPFSMVCKVVEADGNAAVKLSNNIGKATGPKDEVERYIKIFGNDGRGVQAVEV